MSSQSSRQEIEPTPFLSKVHIAGLKIAAELDSEADSDLDIGSDGDGTDYNSLTVRPRATPQIQVMPSNSSKHCCKTVTI